MKEELNKRRNCQAGIRTPIDGTKTRSPAVRRPGNIKDLGNFTTILLLEK